VDETALIHDDRLRRAVHAAVLDGAARCVDSVRDAEELWLAMATHVGQTGQLHQFLASVARNSTTSGSADILRFLAYRVLAADEGLLRRKGWFKGDEQLNDLCRAIADRVGPRALEAKAPDDEVPRRVRAWWEGLVESSTSGTAAR
jgi:hypothetical protein